MHRRMTFPAWRRRLTSARELAAAAIALLILFSLAVAFFSLPSPAYSDAPSAPNPKIVELRIEDEIEPLMAEYVARGIAQANDQDAALILITMNTPGGLETSMRDIIHSILTSKVPVCVFVSPTGSRAASAGFFILLSADVAAMSPGTETGAASPILEFGGEPVKIDETLNKKIINDATAYLRSYVEKRGRNVDLAASAVTDAKAFSDKEALDGKLIDLVASSKDDLLNKLNGRQITRLDGATLTLSLANPSFSAIGMTSREKFLSRIVQPDAFFILLILGVLGIYIEFTHPGLFAPGVFGAICFLLALYAMQLLPVSFAGVLLIVCSLVLFVLEAKYPAHGVLGVGGVIAMLLGALFLIKTPMTGMGVNPAIALGVALGMGAIVIFLMRLVLKSYRWKTATGKEEMIGEVGEVVEPPKAAGEAAMVFVHGELWRALPPREKTLAKGERVRVKKVAGLTLEVEPLEGKS